VPGSASAARYDNETVDVLIIFDPAPPARRRIQVPCLAEDQRFEGRDLTIAIDTRDQFGGVTTLSASRRQTRPDLSPADARNRCVRA